VLSMRGDAGIEAVVMYYEPKGLTGLL